MSEYVEPIFSINSAASPFPMPSVTQRITKKQQHLLVSCVVVLCCASIPIGIQSAPPRGVLVWCEEHVCSS